MSKILFDEAPLVIAPSFAKVVGLNESIILQQLHYWLQKSNNQKNGYSWVYNTYEDWHKQFPFWSVSTIRRIITKLENQELIIVGNFNKIKIDKTKWYRINYPKIEGMNSPCVQNEQSSCSNWAVHVSNLNKAIPEITTEITTDIKKEEEDASENQKRVNSPFHFFEQNGFGAIGGYMSEKISAWCDDLSDELVIEAMKIAVENGTKTWKYVEAILRDWVDKGLQTVEEVHAARQAFKEQRHKQQGQRKQGYNRKPVRQEHIPDWLNNDAPPLPEEPNPNFEDEKKAIEERLKRFNASLNKKQ